MSAEQQKLIQDIATEMIRKYDKQISEYFQKLKKEQQKMVAIRFRAECNFDSKYFADIVKAFRYFYKCIATRKSVELWAITIEATQELLDCVYFH